MIVRRAIGLAAALLASAAAAASAAPRDHTAALPIGTDTNGVLARLVRGNVVITFERGAAGRYRRIAGRTVQVGCVRLIRTTASGAASDRVFTGGRLIAPRHRAPLREFVGETGRRPDYCAVQLLQGGTPHVEIAAVPVSARGATYLDERRTVREIVGLLLLTQRPDGRPTSVASMQTVTRGLVVPVAGPEQRPPTGHVGYWTDGTNEVYLGALSHYGVLFFYAYEINSDIVTTNVLDWLSGQDNP